MMPTISEAILAISGSLAASVVAKVTVITALGLVATRLARGNRAAVRHALLASSFGVILLLPIASFIEPPVHLAVPVAVKNQPSTLPPPSVRSIEPISAVLMANDPGDRVISAPQASRISLSGLLLAGWIAGVALFLLPVMIGLWQIRSLRRSGLPWRRGQSVVETLAREGGIRRCLEVLLHEALPGPMTCGVVYPAIVLPPDAENWSQEDLNRAIIHELEHVRRGDSVSRCLARAVCALYWFHPLVWIAWRRLVLEAERSCDDAVLERSDATAYADQLVGLAKRISIQRSPIVAMANRADLATRLGAVLDTRQRRGRAGILALALACAVAVALVIAMSPLMLVAEPQAAPAQTTTTPKFDIADVHVSPTAPKMGMFVQASGGVIREGRYVNRDATMLSLIEEAYSVSEDTLIGGPAWLDSDLFDIFGKVPEGTTPATANVMLQALLADRFRLVIRRDTRPVPRYVLSIGKDGPKLKPGSGNPGCQLTQQPSGDLKIACHNLTAQGIADNLQRMPGGYVDHAVVDSTKLEGAWDLELEYTLPMLLAAKGRDGMTIFDAVNKQLGMKLELQDVPMPSLVIESVNRKPTENPAGVTTALALAAARFEVATIKPADPKQMMFSGLSYAGGSQLRAGGTLRALIALALDIPPPMAADMVIGLPKSADSQVWDITGKMPSSGEGAPLVTGARPQAPPRSVALEMLRGLLADQFELKTHTENREVTVYAMTLTGGKQKMTQAEQSERSGCRVDPNAPKPFPNLRSVIVCKNTTMAEFARNLRNAAGFIDHPVVDLTGLEGGWDFLYGWSPKPPVQGPSPAGAIAEASDPAYITVFEALQQQLGLKLVKEKRSIPVIVVDHVSEKPIE